MRRTDLTTPLILPQSCSELRRMIGIPTSEGDTGIVLEVPCRQGVLKLEEVRKSLRPFFIGTCQANRDLPIWRRFLKNVS